MIARADEQESADHIAAQAVENFPGAFRQATQKANRRKASRWWTNRDEYLAKLVDLLRFALTLSATRRNSPARCRIERKAL